MTNKNKKMYVKSTNFVVQVVSVDHGVDSLLVVYICFLSIDAEVVELSFTLDFLVFGFISFHVLLFLFLNDLGLVVTLHYDEHKHVLNASVKHETVDYDDDVSRPSTLIIIDPHFSI
jgi:hypothetical protein